MTAELARVLKAIAEMSESVTYVAQNFETPGDSPKETAASLIASIETLSDYAKKLKELNV